MKKVREGLAFQTEKEIRTAIDRIKGMHDRLLVIMENSKEGSIEAYFKHWYHAYYDFCNMLAAICTEHGINLLEIQNRRGIWLVDKLDVMQIQCYFGCDCNFNYANSLLKKLPATNATLHLISIEDNGIIHSRATVPNSVLMLPNELSTPKAIKYLGRAAEANMIDPASSNRRCLIPNVRLGYICSKIYSSPYPISSLEKYFGVCKLSASISQAELEPKRADAIKWRNEIDSIIFFD